MCWGDIVNNAYGGDWGYEYDGFYNVNWVITITHLSISHSSTDKMLKIVRPDVTSKFIMTFP